VNRRDLLQSMGLSALGLSAGGLFLPSRAQAGGDHGPPTRFLLFYSAQGAPPARWLCDPYGYGDVDWSDDWTTWSDAEFSDGLRPLAPWADKVTAIGGLGLVSAEADGSGFRHERSQVHGLTGARASWVNNFPYASEKSLDQRIAEHLARPDRYRSLEVSVGGGLAYDGFGTAVYHGRNQPLPPIDDPAVLWDRLFAAQTGGAVDPVLARQGSVLDAVADRYARVAKGLSSADRRKLSVHQELVRSLEQRIVGVQTAACGDAPARPGSSGDYDADFEHHLQMIAASFSCDLTRVASMQMGQLSTRQLGLGAGDIHADYAHDIHSRQAGEDAMALYTAHHAGQVARILEVLDSIPEGDGSVLDSTVVAWLPELADSWHGMDRFPVVVAGGSRTRLRGGRYVHHARSSPVKGLQPMDSDWMGVPHQKALTSICQAVGMDTNSTGVTEVVGWDGSRIDCTGNLPEVVT
jgi:hypothetical protein